MGRALIGIARIFRSQIRPPVFDDKTFQRRLAIDQCCHNIAISRFLAIVQNDDVAIENVGIHHRIAPHFQRKDSRIFGGIRGASIKGNVAQHRLLGQCCHAGRDLSVNRYIGDLDFLHRGDKSTRFAGVAIQKSFARQGRNVLHDRSLAGEAKMILDFARAGGDAFYALFALDKIKHTSLAIGQHLKEMMQCIGSSASSNEHLCHWRDHFSVGQGSRLPRQAGMPARRPPSSMPAAGRSGGEAFAAGAMRDGIRVGNFKPAFLQVVAEVEDRPADEQRALGIDHDPNIE